MEAVAGSGFEGSIRGAAHVHYPGCPRHGYALTASPQLARTCSPVWLCPVSPRPTAAAVAYRLVTHTEKGNLGFNVDDGTSNVSLLTVDNGAFEAAVSNGDLMWLTRVR